jgi:CheY-like chemotaxis protein
MSKVLILSGKAILREKEKETLAKAGIQVTVLSNYSQALFKNSTGNYNLFVINNDIRGVDTYQVCRRIRGFSRAIIILFGKKAESEMAERRNDIGFDSYYQKPMESLELAIRIKIMLSKFYSIRRNQMINDTKEDKNCNAGPAAAPPVADREKVVANQVKTELSPVPQTATGIWQTPGVARLISGLLSGKIPRLNPEIDLSLKDGFTYREADNILGTSGEATSLILESLAAEGILIQKALEQILRSPGGSVQLIPVESCPKCEAAQITRGKMIEHFNCGHVGPEEEFIKGLKHVCPKCGKELKLIGTDYRNCGLLYSCHSCHDTFPLPTIKFRCLKTGETFDSAELRRVCLYSYSLNEMYRNRLEFEIEPKTQFIDYLHNLGYDVQESVRLQGRSGATHTVDLLASMNESIAEHTVAIGILVAPQDKKEVTLDSLFSYDSKIYDIGIEHKIVLAVPGLTSEAARFAERQGIRVYGMGELRALLSERAASPENASDANQWETVESESAPDLTKLNHKDWLTRLFEQKGYHVDENARIKGRSGAEHILELYVYKNDGIISHQLAACVIAKEQSVEDEVNKVVRFDSAAYDIGIRHKVIIGLSELSQEARQFAEYQHIKVLEAKDLTCFSSLCLTPELQLAVEAGR